MCWFRTAESCGAFSGATDEVTAELASHLYESFERYRKQGLTEAEAVVRATHEVPDWRGLARTIQRAKLEEGTMNQRIKRLWLPGLVSTAIALVLPLLLLMTLTRIGVEPGRYHAGMIGPVCLLTCALGGARSVFVSPLWRNPYRSLGRRCLSGCPIGRRDRMLYRSCAPFRSPPIHVLERTGSFFHTTSLYGAASLLGALPFLRSRARTDSGVSHA